MKYNFAIQRLAVWRRLSVLSRKGSSSASQAAAYALDHFDQFYASVVGVYQLSTGAKVATVDMQGNPIFESLLDFIKWMYESGMLEWLLRLFSGMDVSSSVDAVVATSDNWLSALDGKCLDALGVSVAAEAEGASESVADQVVSAKSKRSDKGQG